MAEKCFAPGDATDDSRTRSVLGEIAEWYVERDYCASKGGCDRYLETRSHQWDFFDRGMGFSRCRHLASYLGMHNPGLDAPKLGAECEAKKEGSKRFPVPDIITHVPRVPGLPRPMGEYYEIKPNSDAGKNAGRNKINWFEDIVARYDLPYLTGSKYRPDKRELVFDGTDFGTIYKVYIHYWLEEDGLLLHEFCIVVNAETLEEAAWKTLIAAAIVWMIWLYIVSGARGSPSPTPALTALLDEVSPQVKSPLPRSVGEGGQNEIDDMQYLNDLYARYQDRRDQEAQLLICIPWWEPGDTAGHCVPDTVAALSEFSPGGKLDPDGAGIRALERDQLLGVISSPIPDNLAPFVGAGSDGEITDEENGGEVIDRTAVCVTTATNYLQALKEFAHIPGAPGPGGVG